MSYIEVDCSLIKYEGQVIGVSLIADAQTEAEMFCNSMPRQLVDGKADIKFEDGRVTFVNPGEGQVAFIINKQDAQALQDLLSRDTGLAIYKDGLLTPGFKIVPWQMAEVGEKIELTRI